MRAVSSALRISSTCPKSFGLRAFQQSLSTKYSPVYTRLDGVPVLTLEARDVRSFENIGGFLAFLEVRKQSFSFSPLRSISIRLADNLLFERFRRWMRPASQVKCVFRPKWSVRCRWLLGLWGFPCVFAPHCSGGAGLWKIMSTYIHSHSLDLCVFVLAGWHLDDLRGRNAGCSTVEGISKARML